jgi:predicted lipid-binding transport protein (Tim44 family)
LKNSTSRKQEDLKKRTDDAKSVFDAQENKKAKENSKYKKKTFDSSSVNFSDDENGDYSSIRSDIVKKQNKEDAEAEKAHLEELLSSHQDYTQKKELIDEKYNKYFKELAAEREEAEKAGDTKKVSEIDRSKMQAQRDYVAETAKNSLSALKDDPTYLSAFEDFEISFR